MNRTDKPSSHVVPFGINGPREPILDSTPSGSNRASYQSGFPEITMRPREAGGIPPEGKDFNQAIYELSAANRWFSSGALALFDPDFSGGVGGYPQGSMLLGNDGQSIFISSINNNTNNPNTSTSGWIKLSDTVKNNLGLGGAAYLDVGTTTGTVASGGDSRIVGAMQKIAALGTSDLNTLNGSSNNGLYQQNSAIIATISRNYPEGGVAGSLLVSGNSAGGSQTYFGVNGTIYSRSFSASASFSAWTIVNGSFAGQSQQWFSYSTSERLQNVVYTNTEIAPIAVAISGVFTSGSPVLRMNGSTYAEIDGKGMIFAVVMPGDTYEWAAGTYSYRPWRELRISK